MFMKTILNNQKTKKSFIRQNSTFHTECALFESFQEFNVIFWLIAKIDLRESVSNKKKLHFL